jgi:hypothetical protein
VSNECQIGIHIFKYLQRIIQSTSFGAFFQLIGERKRRKIFGKNYQKNRHKTGFGLIFRQSRLAA